MSGSARQRTSPGVTLFPFLAVLLCMMGALLLVLVVIARQARGMRLVEQQQARADLSVNQDEIRWRISQYREAKDRSLAQLSEARLELSHLEEHAARLATQVDELAAAIELAEGTAADVSTQQTQRREVLDDLRRELASAETALASARQRSQAAQNTYAVVPYVGTTPTVRRPIYIECRSDSVILQPDQVILTEADFTSNLGPGNPLASALRACQEHLVRQDPAETQKQEPYPFLLIRPDGVAAYYAARAALASWGGDFGYELVDEDWKLKFEDIDPARARAMQAAVDEGRRRNSLLAVASPFRGRAGEPRTYRVRPSGGGLVEEVLPGHSSARLPGWGGAKSGQADSAENDETSGNSAQASRASRSRGTDEAGSGNARGGKEGRDSNERANENDVETDEVRPASDATGGVGGKAKARPTSGSGGLGSNPTLAAGGAGLGSNPAGTGTGTGTAKPGAAGLAFGQRKSGSPHASRSAKSRKVERWGLPESQPNAIPLSRPVGMDCLADELRFTPERGTRDEVRVIRCTDQETNVDELIDAVWERIESWGIAGAGMFWQPVLDVRVLPGGEKRYQELKDLLDGSGLVVRRKNVHAATYPQTDTPE